MHKTSTYSEGMIEINRPHKWWHHQWFKTICISFIVSTIVAVTFSMALNLVFLAPAKAKMNTNTTATTTITSPSTSTTKESSKI